MATTGPDGGRPGRGAGPVVLGVLSAAAHLGPGFLIVVSGLAAPPWAVLLMLMGWLLLSALLVRMIQRRSWWTPVVPVAAMVLWVGTLSAGGYLLDWTA